MELDAIDKRRQMKKDDVLHHCFVMEQFIEKFLYLRDQIKVANDGEKGMMGRN